MKSKIAFVVMATATAIWAMLSQDEAEKRAEELSRKVNGQ